MLRLSMGLRPGVRAILPVPSEKAGTPREDAGTLRNASPVEVFRLGPRFRQAERHQRSGALAPSNSQFAATFPSCEIPFDTAMM